MFGSSNKFLKASPVKASSKARVLTAAVRASGEKNVFITGGNTGIGYETAKALAQKGYRVTIGCRDEAKAQAAIERIRTAVPSAPAVSFVPLDLADLASVRDAAKRVSDSGVAYDVWLNNAGVMACPKMATKQGFEYQLGVNHLGHFALMQGVLPALQAAAKPVRIINVASAAHLFGRIDFDDLMRDKSYDAWEAYGQSKLANIVFSYTLARRLGAASPITVNCLHPGVVQTELGRYMLADATENWYMGPAMEVMKFFMLTPEQGAATSIYLADSPEVAGVTGKYYEKCRRITSSNDSYSREAGERLWQVSEELTEEKASAGVLAAAGVAAA